MTEFCTILMKINVIHARPIKSGAVSLVDTIALERER
jgi:hypothetical protein